MEDHEKDIAYSVLEALGDWIPCSLGVRIGSAWGSSSGLQSAVSRAAESRIVERESFGLA
jgi:hypothetical protein